MTIYRPGGAEEKTRGLPINVEEEGRLKRSNVSFLDMDEVDALSKAISYMISQVKKCKGSSRKYTEVIFSARGKFQIGFYQKGTKAQAFIKSGRIGAATCYFPTGDLPDLKESIAKGRSLLSQ